MIISRRPVRVAALLLFMACLCMAAVPSLWAADPQYSSAMPADDDAAYTATVRAAVRERLDAIFASDQGLHRLPDTADVSCISPALPVLLRLHDDPDAPSTADEIQAQLAMDPRPPYVVANAWREEWGERLGDDRVLTGMHLGHLLLPADGSDVVRVKKRYSKWNSPLIRIGGEYRVVNKDSLHRIDGEQATTLTDPMAAALLAANKHSNRFLYPDYFAVVERLKGDDGMVQMRILALTGDGAKTWTIPRVLETSIEVLPPTKDGVDRIILNNAIITPDQATLDRIASDDTKAAFVAAMKAGDAAAAEALLPYVMPMSRDMKTSMYREIGRPVEAVEELFGNVLRTHGQQIDGRWYREVKTMGYDPALGTLLAFMRTEGSEKRYSYAFLQADNTVRWLTFSKTPRPPTGKPASTIFLFFSRGAMYFVDGDELVPIATPRQLAGADYVGVDAGGRHYFRTHFGRDMLKSTWVWDPAKPVAEVPMAMSFPSQGNEVLDSRGRLWYWTGRVEDGETYSTPAGDRAATATQTVKWQTEAQMPITTWGSRVTLLRWETDGTLTTIIPGGPEYAGRNHMIPLLDGAILIVDPSDTGACYLFHGDKAWAAASMDALVETAFDTLLALAPPPSSERGFPDYVTDSDVRRIGDYLLVRKDNRADTHSIWYAGKKLDLNLKELGTFPNLYGPMGGDSLRFLVSAKPEGARSDTATWLRFAPDGRIGVTPGTDTDNARMSNANLFDAHAGRYLVSKENIWYATTGTDTWKLVVTADRHIPTAAWPDGQLVFRVWHQGVWTLAQSKGKTIVPIPGAVGRELNPIGFADGRLYLLAGDAIRWLEQTDDGLVIRGPVPAAWPNGAQVILSTYTLTPVQHVGRYLVITTYANNHWYVDLGEHAPTK